MVVLTRIDNSYDKYLVSKEVFDGDENIEYKTFSTLFLWYSFMKDGKT